MVLGGNNEMHLKAQAVNQMLCVKKKREQQQVNKDKHYHCFDLVK